MSLGLKYPSFNIKLKKENNQTFVFDPVRKKWLVLTPEEWVRQHVLNFLIEEKNFSPSKISIEKEIQINDVKKRFDIVVYGNSFEPFILIECKAPYIELDESVTEQALRYNLELKSEYVMITNGLKDFIFKGQKIVENLPSN